ncbi:MAG: hypothetical protein U5J63_09400 [Fodinibius sp.]|nr:hypothetical protein [Fodinibius sp.]
MNTTSKIIGLLVILLTVFGYYLFWQEPTEEPAASSPPSMDQFTSPDRPTISASPDTIPEPAGEGLAPGTALVQATILDFTKEQQTITSLSIRVDEVLSYGSSTPPLPVDTELNFDMSYSLDQESEVSQLLAKGESMKLKVGSQQGMAPAGGADVKPWNFIQFVISQ